MKRYFKAKLSDGSSLVVKVDNSTLATVLLKRIKEAVKLQGVRRKVIDFDAVNQKGDPLFE